MRSFRGFPGISSGFDEPAFSSLPSEYPLEEHEQIIQPLDFATLLELYTTDEIDHPVAEALTAPSIPITYDSSSALHLRLDSIADNWNNAPIDSSARVDDTMLDDWDWLYRLVDPLSNIGRLEVDLDEAGGVSTATAGSSGHLGDVGPACSSDMPQATSSKQIICEHCTKTFIRPSTHKEHMSTHLGKKRKSE